MNPEAKQALYSVVSLVFSCSPVALLHSSLLPAPKQGCGKVKIFRSLSGQVAAPENRSRLLCAQSRPSPRLEVPGLEVGHGEG